MIVINEDILRYIADWAAPKTLCQLCLLSRSSCDAVRPMLYGTLSVPADSRVLDTIRANMDLGRVVRRLSMTQNMDEQELGVLFTLLPNVTALEIHDVSPILIHVAEQAIQSYRLQSLNLYTTEKNVDDLLAVIPPSSLVRLYVTAVFVRRTPGLDKLLLLSTRSLRTVEIRPPELLFDILTSHPDVSWPNVVDLATRWTPFIPSSFPNVTRLRLESHADDHCDARFIMKQLKTCRNLEFLSIDCTVHYAPRVSANSVLPKTTLFGLSLHGRYHGTSPMVAVFDLFELISARHLSSVTISFHDYFLTLALPIVLAGCHSLLYLGLEISSDRSFTEALISLGRIDGCPALLCISLCFERNSAFDLASESTVEAKLDALIGRYKKLKIVELRLKQDVRKIVRWRMASRYGKPVTKTTEDTNETISLFDLMSLNPKALNDLQMLR